MPKGLFPGLLILISFALHSQNIDSVFIERGEKYFGFIITPEMDISEFSDMFSIDGINGDTLIAIANLEEFREFLKLGIPYYFLPHPSDLLKFDAVDIHQIKKYSDWDFYPTYDAYLTIMNNFGADFPAICQIQEFGTLPSGRKLLAARITKEADKTSNKPRFLYTATIHGDELTGYVLSLRLIDYMLSNYGSDAFITRLVDSVDIWINPLANPDGTYHYGNHTITGAKRLNASNVDLNRNYPDPEAGPHPDGNVWQPETIIFMNLAENQKFNISANWHGGAEVCNYPWDTWPHVSADNPWWVYTMREYADTTISRSPSPYFRLFDNGITRGYLWYTITGGRQDYMNFFQGCREFTLELSNVKIPALNQLPLYWEYNYRSFLNFIEQSLYGVRGVISDSMTGEPVRAKIFIEGHDLDSSFVYSNLPAGDYHRYLYQGSYNFSFSAPGYTSKTFTNINTTHRQTTWLDVKLSPLQGGINKPHGVLNIKAYPNPVIEGLLNISSDRDLGTIELINLWGSKSFSSISNETNTSIDLRRFPVGLYVLKIKNERGTSIQKIQIL